MTNLVAIQITVPSYVALDQAHACNTHWIEINALLAINPLYATLFTIFTVAFQFYKISQVCL